MNNPVLRTIVILAGVVCFVLAGLAAFGVVATGNPTGFGLLGFACWLASTL